MDAKLSLLSFRLFGLVVATLVSLAAKAGEDFPKQGKYALHWGWQAVAKPTEFGKNQTIFAGEFVGVNFNDSGRGFMHHTAFTCPFTSHVDSGRMNASGYCVGTDADGDKVYQRWSCSGTLPLCEGEDIWLSGTGKYSGITGRGPFRASFIGATTSGWADWSGEYRIP